MRFFGKAGAIPLTVALALTHTATSAQTADDALPAAWTLIQTPAQDADQDVPLQDLPTVPETTVVPPPAGTSSAGPTPPAGGASVAAPAQATAGAGQQTAPTPGQYPAQPLPADTVVTATRSEQQASQVGSSLTVISREAIRNSGQTHLADVLRSVPGLDVVPLGGPGQQTSIFMRGANSNQTKVLLDGMPINDPSSPGRAFDFSFLSVDQIERVEVLRGPQSTLYGSDAIGGVINIITRRGGTPGTTISAGGGTFSTSRTAASHSGGDERFFYSVGGSYYDTNGFSSASRPPGNTEADFYRNGTVSGRFGWNVSDATTLDLIVRHHNTDTGVDAGSGFGPGFLFFPQDDDSTLQQDNTFVRAQATLRWFDGIWVQRWMGGYTQFDRLSLSPFGGTFYGRSGEIDWQNDLLLLENDAVRWLATSGIDFREEVGRSSASPDARLGNLAGYVQSSLDVGDRLFLTGGARWDHYSLAGSAFTYRFTGRYEFPSTDTALHGAIGTGFRAPAIDELFGLVGNINLAPESSKGWEAGLQQRLLDRRLTVDATYFRNDFDNLIVFAPGPNPPFFGSLDNVASALASGVELTSLWAITDESTAFVNYTFTDTRDRATGDELLRRPRDKWSTGISRTLPRQRANLTLQANYIGDRRDFAETLDSYWLVNTAAWYQANDVWRLFGRVDNLLDENFEPATGYQGTPAAFFGGAEATF